MEETFVVKDDGDYEAVSEDFLFAAGVVELSMILNESDYMGDATLGSAYELVMQGSADDFYREELADMIRTLAY